MAIYGVYDGSAVITDQKFKKNQRFILIPVESDSEGSSDKIDLNKKALIASLYGSVPDYGLSYDEVKDERINRL